MRKNRLSKDQCLVQTRISAKALRGLERQAEIEGSTTAAILRHLAEEHVTSRRSLFQRVRAIEVALVNYGIVPESVAQPRREELKDA